MSFHPERDGRFVDRFASYAETLDCVHCGLCISDCPTYGLSAREADSPRGRIYLLRAFAEGTQEISGEAKLHLDQCIVCRACETVCPSGIRMAEMMEAFRADVRRRETSPTWRARLGRMLLNNVLTDPDRVGALSDLLWVYQRIGLRRVVRALLRRVSGRLAWLHDLQPEMPHRRQRGLGEAAVGTLLPAHGTSRLRVGLFLGCITREWFSATHRSTIRVLRRNGCDVVVPTEQACCGALHRHAGYVGEAALLHARNVEAFARAGVDAVVVNAAGCGAALKEPPHGAEAGLGVPVRDVCELLDEIGIAPPRGRVPRRVVYQQPCHLVHGQKIGARVVEGLLAEIPGVAMLPLESSDRCCGSGGIYNLLYPEIAGPLRDEKVRTILAAGADTVVTGNPGCSMHIASGLRSAGVSVCHPIELLDLAYQRGEVGDG